ncbi:MAG: carbohydrate ABC transporter permease [Faecalimonas sp.]|nr:carbohydrate ABC transporter permease [Faecalimonas sp.]
MKKIDIFKNFRRKSPVEIALHIFVSIVFFAVAASYVYILAWAVIAGTKTHNEIVLEPFGLPKAWHWEHFAEVFQRLEVNGNNFWDMLFNSVYFSVVTTLISQFTTMSFAYACSKYKFPGQKLVYPIILVMMTLPLYGSGGATYTLISRLGLVDSYWHILLAIGGFGPAALYYMAYFKNLSWTYAEAAKMDGANDYQIYFKVMIPLAKPIFGALYLTNWLAQWNSYESQLMYLPSLPTLPVGIYQFNTEMIYRARLDILFAACIIICIPALILFIVFNKTITTNVSIGGIKG